MAAEELNITSSAAEEVDETGLNRFQAYYSTAPMDYTSYYLNDFQAGQPLSEQVYYAQRAIMQKLASRSSCVIVGRCADYILEEEPGLISVFVFASKEDKIRRIAKKYQLSDKKAADKIRKVDRERRYYYELHTGPDWGSPESHQIVLNVSMLGMDQAVEVLAALYEEKKKELEE